MLRHSVVSDSATQWTVACQGSSVWDSSGKNTGVGCHFLLQGIFPTQDQTQVSHSAGRRFTLWATREATLLQYKKKKKLILKKEKEAKLLFPQSKLLKDFLPYLLIYLTLYPLSDLMSSFSSHWALDALQTLLIFSQLWGIFHFLKCSSSSCLCSWLP